MPKKDYSNWAKEELIQELNKAQKRKKYGIVWEDKQEEVAKLCKEKLPVLAEETDKEILTDKDKPINILIEGDNYHALSVLNYTHKSKVDVIYIDPPYNTGEEFKFNDKWVDEEDTYRHSKWLSFIEKRLKLAKELLKKTGIIFISIDENEVAQLKLLCDEIFGPKNYVEQIVWNKRIPKNDKGIGNIHEYVLVYVKDRTVNHRFALPKEGLKEVFDLVEKLKRQKKNPGIVTKELKKLYRKSGYDRGITLYDTVDKNYKIWGKINLCWPNAKTVGPRYEILHPLTKKPVRIPQKGWRWKKGTFEDYMDLENKTILENGSVVCGQIWFGATERTQPSFIQYLEKVEGFLLRSIISLKSDGGMELRKILGAAPAMHPKPVSLIKYLLSSCENNHLVLDFFAGSGTTGQAVLDLNLQDGGNRKFILCTNNEVDEKTEKILAKRGVKQGSLEFECEGICQKICYPRISKVIMGYNDINHSKVRGYGGNLKYFKTDFVDLPTDWGYISSELFEPVGEQEA